MLKVNDREDAGLDVEVDVPLFGVNIEEEHLETAEAFRLQLSAVKELLVAHDLLEDVDSAALVEEEAPLPGRPTLILLGQKDEEALRLIISRLVSHHRRKQLADVLVAQIAVLRVGDEELNEAHKAVDILLMRPVVVDQPVVVISLWTLDSRPRASRVR